jgi:phosphoenolpyruvate-protein kinase (PTS system EI component)
MLPLVTLVEEVQEVRDIVQQEGEALKQEGIPAATTLPVGVMIETPAAALIADRLAEVSAFFSIGTNDLTQYTLAVDRGNARLADRFLPHHPAIVRQLHQVLQVGRAAGVPVSVCGEMASEPLSAVLLLGLGYEQLSVSPPALPLVKWVIRTVPDTATAKAAEAALAAASAREVSEILRGVVGQYIDVRLLDPHSALPGRGRVATLPPGKSL